jgi:hypothetical protein
MVKHFNSLENDYLRSQGLTIKMEIQFTDGCGSQYKSKGPFFDISNYERSAGWPVQRHFFGSRHGKGPSDGEGGVIKSKVDFFVKTRKYLVRNGKEMFEVCKQELTKDGPCHLDQDSGIHSRRIFTYTPGEIERNVKERNGLKTIKGTRDFHTVKSVNTPGTVAVRPISCLCTGCNNGERCVNSDCTVEWDEKILHEE